MATDYIAPFIPSHATAFSGRGTPLSLELSATQNRSWARHVDPNKGGFKPLGTRMHHLSLQNTLLVSTRVYPRASPAADDPLRF